MKKKKTTVGTSLFHIPENELGINKNQIMNTLK